MEAAAALPQPRPPVLTIRAVELPGESECPHFTMTHVKRFSPVRHCIIIFLMQLCVFLLPPHLQALQQSLPHTPTPPPLPRVPPPPACTPRRRPGIAASAVRSSLLPSAPCGCPPRLERGCGLRTTYAMRAARHMHSLGRTGEWGEGEREGRGRPMRGLVYVEAKGGQRVSTMHSLGRTDDWGEGEGGG